MRAIPARLSKTTAFYLQASIIVFFLVGSIAPTPIYSLYQAAWHLSPITITIVFGIYAIAVLSALLVFGSISDHIGRRPVLLVATVLQVITMIIFATADGLGALLTARIVQGLSTGAAAGAVGAGMLDIDRQKGTIANAVGPMLGTGSGGIFSGLMVQYLPFPTKLVYLVLAVIFATQAILVALMPETVTVTPQSRANALASFRPKITLPPALREAFVIATPALIGAWALAGFYGSLGPMLVRDLSGSSSRALAGLAIFIFGGSGVVTVFLMRAATPRVLMTFGTTTLTAGVAMTLVAISNRSLAMFLVAISISGIGFGASFQGGIRSVMARAGAHERAGVLSALYVVAYISMGSPVVLAGLRVVHGGGIFTTAREYGIVVMILASLALVGTLLRTSATANAAKTASTNG